MDALRNVSVRSRFYLILALVALPLLALSLWGLMTTRSSVSTVETLFTQATDAATGVGSLRESMANLRRYESAMMAVSVSNPSDVETFFKLWKAELENLDKGGQYLVQVSGGNAEIVQLVQTQKALIAEYSAVIAPIAEKLQDAQLDASAALAYAARADETTAALQQNSAALLKAQQIVLDATRTELSDGMTLASMLRLAFTVGVLVLVVPLMWFTLQSVCRPLEDALDLASRISHGDLSTDFAVTGRDEPARMMRALHGMQESLRNVVGQVRASAQNIQVASTEVANGNADLSARTEQAASNLQQTAASMEQLTGNVRQSADSASTANQLASSAAQVAQRGGQVVSQVVSTMDEINASSKKIADIITVIDGIAFQTNILALNAAVEAARAGEQGRGFAVVAGEVRSLAQRSAEAAKEIKALIGSSVDRVEAGSKLVGDAGATMNEIVASVQRVTDIIGEITAASSEQSSGIGQVNTAVTQLDQMTQQNAALVEESAAAAESLKQQASALAQVVATFRLEREQSLA